LGGRFAEEDEAVEIDHRMRVDADPERVRRPAGEVVGAEHHNHRQPVEDKQEDLPWGPAERGTSETTAGPGDHELTLDRDPVVSAPADEGRQVEAERTAPQHRPACEVETGCLVGPDLRQVDCGHDA
jgi:hypothetical protein